MIDLAGTVVGFAAGRFLMHGLSKRALAASENHSSRQ
jgi:hypothetical protein